MTGKLAAVFFCSDEPSSKRSQTLFSVTVSLAVQSNRDILAAQPHQMQNG
jgi:hypothetical protein